MTLVTFENIIVGTFLFVILLGLIGALLAFIKYAILYPLSSIIFSPSIQSIL